MTEPIFSLSPDEIAGIARKIKSSRDYYTKMNVLVEEGISWADRYRALWWLIGQEAYDAHEDPAIWYELAESVDQVSTKDLVDFLARVQRYDEEPESETEPETEPSAFEGEAAWDDYVDDSHYEDYAMDGEGYSTPPFESKRIVSFWPWTLDTLAMNAYARDPEMVEGRAADFHPDVQRGLQLVRRRFGAIPREELPQGTLEDLAERFVWETFHGNLWDVVDGELSFVIVNGADETARANRARFFSHFADEETWARLVLTTSLSRDYAPQNYERTRAAWKHCSLEQLKELITRISVHTRDRVDAIEVIVSRGERPQDLLQIAGGFAAGNLHQKSEFIALAAILTALRNDQPVPDEALDFISFLNLDTPFMRSEFFSVPIYMEALGAFEDEQITSLLRRAFADPQRRSLPFPVMHAYAHDPEVLQAALEAVEFLAEENQRFNRMTKLALSLGLLGPDHLRPLADAFDRSSSDLARSTFRRAILGVLADQDITPDESIDRFLSLVDMEAVGTSENNLGYHVAADYRAALSRLPVERAVARVLRDIDEAKPHWIRVVAALQALPHDALLEEFFRILIGVPLPSSLYFDWFKSFLQDLPEQARPFLSQALATCRDPDLHNAVASALSQLQYEDLLAERGAQSAADKSPADKLRRLCDAYFEAHPEVVRTTIYTLDRQETPSRDGSLNRLGGRPVGLTLESWPLFRDDPDHPMHHLLTLDLNTLPELKTRFPEHRVISLFIEHPYHHEAYGPGNESVRVLFIADEAALPYEGDLPTSTDDPAVGFLVEEVEVPLGAWSVSYGSDERLEEIRKTIYSLHAWGGGDGGPFWLQQEEHQGDFLLQFDEAFAHMNLGDAGLMFLFADTAFFQCH